jgi:hypothetical protein
MELIHRFANATFPIEKNISLEMGVKTKNFPDC